MKTLKRWLEKTRIKFAWSMVPEMLLGVFLLWAFFKVAGLLRSVDSTAATVDAGILHFLLLGAVTLVGGIVVVWALINLTMRFLDRWFDGDEEADPAIPREARRSLFYDFRAAKPHHRLFWFAGVFFGFLFAFILAVGIFLA